MIYSQTRDIKPMPDAHVRRRELTIFKTSLMPGAQALKLNKKRRFMRPILSRMKNLEPHRNREGLLERD